MPPRRAATPLVGPPGTLFPVGIAQAFFNGSTRAAGPISTTPGDPCYPQHLTPGNLNVPGGFGWLKFGCDGYGLGQVRRRTRRLLQLEAVPPGRDRAAGEQLRLLHGQVGLPGSPDKIGSLPGNKASADCSLLHRQQHRRHRAGLGLGRRHRLERLVPHRRLHRLPADRRAIGGKDIEGVWRVPIVDRSDHHDARVSQGRTRSSRSSWSSRALSIVSDHSGGGKSRVETTRLFLCSPQTERIAVHP